MSKAQFAETVLRLVATFIELDEKEGNELIYAFINRQSSSVLKKLDEVEKDYDNQVKTLCSSPRYKLDVARFLFPHLDKDDSALHAFNNLLGHTPGLLAHLRATGYTKSTRIFTQPPSNFNLQIPHQEVPMTAPSIKFPRLYPTISTDMHLLFHVFPPPKSPTFTPNPVEKPKYF